MPDNVNGRIMNDTWQAARAFGYSLASYSENYLMFYNPKKFADGVQYGESDKTPVTFGKD